MIFVSYRNNSLFEKYLPSLLEDLPITSQFVIPAGTKLEDKKDEYVAAVDEAAAKGARLWLLDQTCNMYYAFTKRSAPIEKWVSFDRQFRSQVDAWNRGNTVAQNLRWFAEQVANGREVRKVVVVIDHLFDHDLAGTEAPAASWEEGPKGVAKWVVQQLSSQFPTAEVLMTDCLNQALDEAGDPSTLLVMDRHCGIKQVMGGGCAYSSLENWPHPAMLYILPFETCSVNLVDRGNFEYTFDIATMKAEIREALEKSG